MSVKVLHIIAGLDPASGGPAQALVGLATAQSQLGTGLQIIAPTRVSVDRTFIDRLERVGVAVRTVGPCRGPLGSHPDLRGVVEDGVRQTDVVHIHGLWEQIQHDAATICRRHDKPYIFRPCGMLDPWCLNQAWLKKRIYMAWRLRRNLNGAALLHFTSDVERDLTGPLRLKPPSVVEANGVDMVDFAELPPRGLFRSRFPIIGDRPMVLFMSRLHGKKGLDLLIPAFAQIDNRDAVLVLAGPDDRGYKIEVQAMVARHALAERVVLPGMLKGEQKVAALVDADLFALPSYQENFGIAVVEALAAGTPVIISDQVNIHQEISQAGVGAVVATQVQPLVEALNTWLADEPLRREAAARARPFVKQRYDWNEIAARWLRRYESLIGASLPDDAATP